MQLRTTALCVLLMSSAALAQKFTGVIEQRVIHMAGETLIQISGEIAGTPTPEQEAFGFDPEMILKMWSPALLTAAKEIDGNYTETINTIYVSPVGVRADMQTSLDQEKVSYIIRHDKRVTWVITPRKKKYLEFAFANADEGKPLSKVKSNDESSLKKTGERATINGLPSERYFTKDSNGMRELWVASDFGGVRATVDDLARQLAASIDHAEQDDDDPWRLMPDGLPIVAKKLSPREGLVLEEIKSIKRQPVEAKLFEIPAGYKKVELSEMKPTKLQ
jgi:hypothetical protein